MPEEWAHGKRPVRMMLAAGYLGVLALGALFGAVVAFTTGDRGTAVGLAVVGVFLGHIVAISGGVLRRPRGGGRPTHDEGGRAFRYSFLTYYLLLVVVGLTALALVALTLGAALGGGIGGWLVALLAAAGGVYLIRFLVIVLRRAPGKVVLTPSGIHHRGMTFDHFLPWASVYDVRAAWTNQPVIVVLARGWEPGIQHHGRLPTAPDTMVVHAQHLGANALPAYEALRYYFHHLYERANLADGDHRS